MLLKRLKKTAQSSSTQYRQGSGEMFDVLAPRYDLLNRMMSLGLDQRWRRQMVKALYKPNRTKRILDVATGTGDVALRLALEFPQCEVVGIDPSEEMLKIARRKSARQGFSNRCSFLKGDILDLPFPDNAFDHSCIAFGIRNVTDRARGLRELARVTHTSGLVSILELGMPRHGIMAALARMHAQTFAPVVGGLFSIKDDYDYLQRSMGTFPQPNQWMHLMEENAIIPVGYQAFGMGIAHLYVGRITQS